MLSSRRSSWPRDRTWVPCISCFGRQVLYHWATWGALYTFIIMQIKSESSTYLLLSYFSCVRFFATLWTVACQVPLSLGFSRQEYWSGLPFPSPGDLPNPGIEPGSPTLQADALTSEPPGKPHPPPPKKNTLEGINSRISEAEERISELEDKSSLHFWRAE